ncbi:ATP-grasp fold amidoligase family protein [Salinimicrobium sediminilitoris]|uniref:ATP-grasp fold amidoligase family protein n=1 Tax=Salinimicrobium sediminilitoris TaxID=2876715 RepID=UPI001E364421|nr:ATP-grasp fold amidoligase family protein [Salinimicrobium sediminilitoris]MCC8358518.1 glycosyltransferase [Salinimicrobium sediminilitoris]
MSLAVVIPYYKKNFFFECLDSLSRQSNKNFIVYVGNDASPENPLDIISHFSQDLDIKYHYFPENMGGVSLTKQWHRCINLSQGEKWIMILGDDDYLSSNYVEEFYRNLEDIENRNIKVVRYASKIHRTSSGEVSKKFTHPKIEKSTDFIYRRYFEVSRGSLTEQIFRRDQFLKYGFHDFPLAWGADLMAWLEFSEFEKNYAINDATAFFRISDHNISRGGYLEETKQNARVIFFSKLIYDYIEKFEPYQRLKLILLFEQILYTTEQFSFLHWFKLSHLILKEGGLLQLAKFNRRSMLKLSTLFVGRETFKNALQNNLSGIKLRFYRLRRKVYRQRENLEKTEFERRIWKRQQLYFGNDHLRSIVLFKLYRQEDWSTWKNMDLWQRRLENKWNAKEFALKAGCKVAEVYWRGRREDFESLDLSILPKTFIVKPILGEASKNVFLMKDGYNLFDKKSYSFSDLRIAINILYKSVGVTEIIIEEFLSNEAGEIKVPNDYRFYTFNGKIRFIQLDKRTGFAKEQVSFYTENWDLIKEKVLIDASVDKYDPPPACLQEMIREVKKLSTHYKLFCRIDFYASSRGAIFGEFTPTPRKGKNLTRYGNRELIEAWDNYCNGMV